MKCNSCRLVVSIGALIMLLLAAGQAQTASPGRLNAGTPGTPSEPRHPELPLFKGAAGFQKTELYFNPDNRQVTAKVLVDDPQGNFIPTIRPSSFAIYDNGVRRTAASVNVEHLPVTVGILAEYGGRYPSLNDALADIVGRLTAQFTEEVENTDRLALWRYGDQWEESSGFSEGREPARQAAARLTRPPFSEVNLYDALKTSLERIKRERGRRAVVLISTGIDTFSQARFEDVISEVQATAIPIFVVDISQMVRSQRTTTVELGSYPTSRWRRASRELAQIARVSGGRLYAPEAIYDGAPIFDDVLETLRLRYAVRYELPADADLSRERTVRIELIDPSSGRLLNIVDKAGKPVRNRMSVQEAFVPERIAPELSDCVSRDNEVRKESVQLEVRHRAVS